MEKTDNQLVEDFLNGDELAFKLLLEKYLKPIFNFLFQMTRDAAVSEDLAQETFIKVWKNIRRYDSQKKFKTWIFTIAKNSAYDYFKKKKSIPFSRFTDEDGNNKLENIMEESELPDEWLHRKDAARELKEILKKLPEHYKIILELRYKDDFSLLEIAEILNKPYNTVKSGHIRALAKLKEILKT